jgi:ribosome-binding factor A
MARVNEVLREVLAEEIEVVASTDARLELVTVTAVSCDPDLRHATVLLASLPDAVREALGEARPRLQAAIAHQVRMKRTPQLSFQADPAVGHAKLIEEILRDLRASGGLREGTTAEPAPGAAFETAGEAGGPTSGEAHSPAPGEGPALGHEAGGVGGARGDGGPGSAEPAA